MHGHILPENITRHWVSTMFNSPRLHRELIFVFFGFSPFLAFFFLLAETVAFQVGRQVAKLVASVSHAH